MFCFSEIIIFFFKKMNFYLQYFFFYFGTNLFFMILSQTSIEQKKLIKLTISIKTHFKQELDIKKKRTFGKIFAIELLTLSSSYPSHKKKSV